MTDNPQCFSEHMAIGVGQFHAASTPNQQLESSISEVLELLGPNDPALTPSFSLLDFSNNVEKIYQKEYLDPVEGGESELSTEEVMRVAAFNFIQLSPSTILQFTPIQAILDNIASAKRIHMIDLSILLGLQWPILMQALATRSSCRIDLLKVSAVVSSEELVAATGKRLSSFAASLNLPFEFRSLIVPDMKDLREDMFELKEGEAVGVYSSLNMSSLIVKRESLEDLMEVIQNLMPCVVTVIDVEAKHNSKSFINRFTESLSYFSALFDCLDILMERNNVNRIDLEGMVYTQVIRNTIAAEGNERTARHVGVWREFFARFRLVETELSEWSLYQSSLLLKQFPKGDSCALETDGKSLLIGWKGTLMNFVSAWKFQKGWETKNEGHGNVKAN